MDWIAYGDWLKETVRGISVIVALAYLSGRFPIFVRNLLADELSWPRRAFYCAYFSLFSVFWIVLGLHTPGTLYSSYAVGPIAGGMLGGRFVGMTVGLVGGLFRIYSGRSLSLWIWLIPLVLVGWLAGFLQKHPAGKKNRQTTGFLLVLIYQLVAIIIFYLDGGEVHLPITPFLSTLFINATGVAVYLSIAEQLRHEKHRLSILENLALTDGLTGLYNHRYFQERLAREIDRVQRLRAASYSCELSVLFIDLDSFKQYNDTYGHQAGDRLLQNLAVLFKRNVRSHDIVSRYGGEEFAVILPDTGNELACEVAERLRKSTAQHLFVTPQGKGTYITISVGVSSMTTDKSDQESLIRSADEALYRAKQEKNRVENSLTTTVS